MPTMNGQMPGSVNGRYRPVDFPDPVFVLCTGRSGSTLLRFVLDAHPDLACPPETNLPGLCAQLATVWSLIEGGPLSAERGSEPPVIPDTAITGIRQTVNLMVGSYLARRGKKRYCDKSLGTARFAELLLRIFPHARFLCLYRHPMDVIASGIEACPWGLNGYGFDPYIASTPGNAVLALASFWIDNAAGILAAEQRFPGACHRVRYEDMVSDPEGTADGIFRFLGVPPVPGISRSCFTADRERSGPADYKIWHTSQVTAGSVGRGWSVPAGMIEPQVLAQMCDLLGQLRYVPVDEGWGTASVPPDLRLPTDDPAGAAPPAAPVPPVSPDDSGQDPPVAALISARLSAGLAGLDEWFARRWEPCLAEPFGLVVIPPVGGRGECRWRADFSTRSAVMTAGGGDDDTRWDVIGAAGAWEKVLRGETNLSVALRRCELRYCDAADAEPVATDTRIGMLADLLGLTSWEPAGMTGPQRMTAAVRS